ncbi:hypothetical protein AAFF_G00329640 [Aldrovandia affinis]|uniref:Uncharacterized protein n=1 Tax=Aldrovandia affinis TaxID=143900 RepID=A0AAD7WQA3_9TELE|nr:hypothetical protein AAFF_G00329640 [Aldrovandia affinis]
MTTGAVTWLVPRGANQLVCRCMVSDYSGLQNGVVPAAGTVKRAVPGMRPGEGKGAEETITLPHRGWEQRVREPGGRG